MVETILSKNLYDNPFEEINANVIDTKSLVEYWCNPFDLGLLSNFDEKKFCNSKIPIILQGSRGSGKTTILKYFSYPAQIERSKKLKDKSFLKQIKTEKEIGFYFRCEESFVSTFTSIFRNVKPENWTKIFECFIELVFSEKILEMLDILVQSGEVDNCSPDVIKDMLIEVGIENTLNCTTLHDLYNLVHKEVIYFEQYKNRIVFKDEVFNPKIFVDIFTLSGAIISRVKETIPEFKNVLFLLMLDEYENLNTELQKCFNIIIKFVKSDISIRIGMRSEGVFTTETVNSEEYLRENHDFYMATLGKEPKIEMIRKYFLQVASRRFMKISPNRNNDQRLDIIHMIGDKEDLVNECKEVCKNNKTHVHSVLKQLPVLKNNEELRNEIVGIIKNDNDPIAETINALWVVRSKKKNVLEVAYYASKAMDGFFSGQICDGVDKFKLDYSNKYKYAITVYICSIYKKEKLYYGFNALSHLSNGNVRTFLNFCQAIVNAGLFYENKHFLETGKISRNVQSNAIRSFARTEFDSICSVVFAGDKIKRLVSNIGNSLSEYHKDRKIRYPETTQFTYDEANLIGNDRDVLKTAESWAIIIRRGKEQRVSAGVKDRNVLFHLNKMFSPLFNISYRTRGGVNLRLSVEEVHSLMNKDSFFPNNVNRIIATQDVIETNGMNEDNRQFSLFDMENDYE